MERLDALLDDACGRAGEVQSAADPKATMRVLLAPLRLELHALATAAARSERERERERKPSTSSSSGKAPAAYLSEAATRLQALMLSATSSGPRAGPAASVTSNSSSNKSVVEAPKSTPLKPANYFSGAASRLQALVRGSNGPAASVVAAQSARHSVKERLSVQLMPKEAEAATRIQALVRGKSERISFVRQKSFLLQGTKVRVGCVCVWGGTTTGWYSCGREAVVVSLFCVNISDTEEVRAQARPLSQLPRARHAVRLPRYVSVCLWLILIR